MLIYEINTNENDLQDNWDFSTEILPEEILEITNSGMEK